MQPKLGRIIARGQALESQGNLDAAEAELNKGLRIDPGHFGLLDLLGLIALKKGEFHKSVHYLTKAAEQNPQDFRVFTTLSVAQIKLGALDAAFDSVNRAIALKHDCAEAYLNRGYIYLCLSQFIEALDDFSRAANLKPNYADAHLNRGIALHKMNQFDSALAAYKTALSISPRKAEIYDNLAQTLSKMNRLDEALVNFNTSLVLNPSNPIAFYNRGNTLQECGRLAEALESYTCAISLNPFFAEAYNNRGNVLQGLRRLEEARDNCNKAIELNPSFPAAYNNLANILRELGRLDEALESCGRAIQLHPEFAEAYSNRADTLAELGRLTEADENYRIALSINPRLAATFSNLIFNLNYRDDSTAESIKQEAIRFGNLTASSSSHRYAEWRRQRSPLKLKVGFVSGDMRNHPVGYFTEEIFPHLAQSRLELFAYPTFVGGDALTMRIKDLFAGWRPLIGLSDSNAAAKIYEDDLHILVDLSGHTGLNRLPVFAYKPAPIQISWLGYCGTTGVAEMDYLLGDPIVTPERDESHFSEKIWRLPDTYWCFSPPKEPVATGPLPALRNGSITFGCFNNLKKVNRGVISVWSRILRAIPESKLFLKAKQLSNETIRNAIIAQFAAHGVSPERLALEGHSSRSDYLEAYNKVDIALDTFPYPGGATSLEGLWMGVPFITMKGDRFYSHNGEAIAANAGLPDWIAEDEEGYIQKAIEISARPGELAGLRRTLRDRTLVSALFDAHKFSDQFEKALWEMWELWAQANC
jgi:predicted O-linked N-acetylglucosamine transferase (SPINDLY family)